MTLDSFNGAALFRARRCPRHSAGPPHRRRCFNGAALFRARRYAWATERWAAVDVASTGPRSFERGDTEVGHDATERRIASTGPRSFERGDYLSEVLSGTGHTVASTGPRSFERGDPFARDAELAETRQLQRGRALSSAEIPLAITRAETKPHCFNGAALFRARRCVSFGSVSLAKLSLQRGRALSSAEIFQSINGPAIVSPCFNGAALFRARRCIGGRPHPGSAWCFNGAALFRARR